MSIVWPVSINSTGNLEHGALLWLFRGSLHVALVLRTSYTLSAEPLISVPADPVDDQDRHYGNDPAYPVRTASDLVPYLARPEILHAGAVVGPPGRNMTVRLSLNRNGKPILGKRSIATTKQPCPGLGPLGRLSNERRVFLRNAPEPKLGMDAILKLPDTMDFRFYQCAPYDQQCDQIHGGDQLLLQNLHPDHADLTVVLPSRAPMARAYLGNEEAHLLLECKRVLVDTDRRRLTLNWYADIELPGPSAIPYLRIEAIAPDAAPASSVSDGDYEPTVRLSVQHLVGGTWDIDDSATVDLRAPVTPDQPLPFAAPRQQHDATPASTSATPWGKSKNTHVPTVGDSTVSLGVKVPTSALEVLAALDAAKPPAAPKAPEVPKPAEIIPKAPQDAPGEVVREAPRAVVYREVPQEAPPAPKAPPTPPKATTAPAAASAVHPKKGAYDRFKR